MTHPVLGVVCDLLRARFTSEKDSVVIKSAFVRTKLTDFVFVENCDIFRISSSVWLTTRTSHCRERLGGAQKFAREFFN